MTKQEFQGLEKEVKYQKHMIENLGRWLNLSFLVASIGIVLIYAFLSRNLILTILGGVLTAVGVIACLIFGLGIRNGRRNVNKIIDDMEAHVHAS